MARAFVRMLTASLRFWGREELTCRLELPNRLET